MAKSGGIPRRPRLPSLAGVMMVDTVRGVLRVRKWPRKRGRPKSELQRWWNDWFKQANLLAKYASAYDQERAIHHSKGSGFYPRDIILKAMRGRLYWWTDQTGWRWFPVAAIGDISLTLDVLAQTVGDVLVRASDRWRPPPAGSLGQVLTHQGAGNPPAWQAAGGGGGGPSFTQMGYSRSTQGSQATQGWWVDLAVNMTVHGANPFHNAPAGHTFQSHVVELNVLTITAVLASSAAFVVPAAGPWNTWMPFTPPVALVAGKRYAIVCTKTSGAASTNSNLLRAGSLRVPVPIEGELRGAGLVSLSPAVGQTFVNVSNFPWIVNILHTL